MRAGEGQPGCVSVFQGSQCARGAPRARGGVSRGGARSSTCRRPSRRRCAGWRASLQAVSRACESQRAAVRRRSSLSARVSAGRGRGRVELSRWWSSSSRPHRLAGLCTGTCESRHTRNRDTALGTPLPINFNPGHSRGCLVKEIPPARRLLPRPRCRRELTIDTRRAAESSTMQPPSTKPLQGRPTDLVSLFARPTAADTADLAMGELRFWRQLRKLFRVG